MIPLAGLSCSLNVVLEDFRGHLSGDASRAYDESFMIFFEVGAVGARSVIVPVYPSIRHEPNEILISVIVFRKHDEVVSRLVAFGIIFVFLAAASHIHLTSEYGFERL